VLHFAGAKNKRAEMAGNVTDKSSPRAAMTRRLAAWINDFGASTIPTATAERARAILLDSIGCALAASAEDKARPIFESLPRMGAAADCTIIGSYLRSSLPTAAFGNGALIRMLDLNDTYTGPRQIGHPSDNIGAALAAAELNDRSGVDLLRAIRLGYEIYGRILDMTDPESPWDHVTVSGLVTAAITGWLLRLPTEQLANALALAAMHCATLGEVRVGKVSGAKSIANSVVVQTATMLTLLAAAGVTGPEQALEGRRGYAKLILDGADFADFFKADGDDRLLAVGLKQYPCFALGQGPISAAIELRKKVPRQSDIKRLTVALADTGPARLRLGDEHGRMPTSSEAADHSIYFLVAVAVLDGRFGVDQLRDARWQDADVTGLMARMEAIIDPTLTPKTALPCRLEAMLADGSRCTVERLCTPGFASNPLSWHDVVAKFRSNAGAVISDKAQRDVIACVEDVDRLSSVRMLLRPLVPGGQRA
jgi:2-methylcitrate dehydratase